MFFNDGLEVKHFKSNMLVNNGTVFVFKGKYDITIMSAIDLTYQQIAMVLDMYYKKIGVEDEKKTLIGSIKEWLPDEEGSNLE